MSLPCEDAAACPVTVFHLMDLPPGVLNAVIPLLHAQDRGSLGQCCKQLHMFCWQLVKKLSITTDHFHQAVSERFPAASNKFAAVQHLAIVDSGPYNYGQRKRFAEDHPEAVFSILQQFRNLVELDVRPVLLKEQHLVQIAEGLPSLQRLALGEVQFDAAAGSSLGSLAQLASLKSLNYPCGRLKHVLQTLGQVFTNLTEMRFQLLNVSDSYEPAFQLKNLPLLKNMTQLRSLYFARADWSWSPGDLSCLMAFQALESVTLRNEMLSLEDLQAIAQLHHLTHLHCGFLECGDVDISMPVLASLHSLHLEPPRQRRSICCDFQPALFPSLHTAVLQPVPPIPAPVDHGPPQAIDPPAETYHLRPMPSLRHFQAEAIDTFYQSTSNVTSLTSLTVTFPDLERLFNSLASLSLLQQLELVSPIHVVNNASALTPLQHCNLTHLTALQLQGFTGLTDQGLACLAEHVTQLRHVELHACSNVTDAGVAHVAHMPLMGNIIVCDCCQTSRSGCMALMQQVGRYFLDIQWFASSSNS